MLRLWLHKGGGSSTTDDGLCVLLTSVVAGRAQQPIPTLRSGFPFALAGLMTFLQMFYF